MDNDQPPGISNGLFRIIMLTLLAAALLVYALAYVSDGQCPGDSGLLPSRGLDGRTVCVVPAR